MVVNFSPGSQKICQITNGFIHVMIMQFFFIVKPKETCFVPSFLSRLAKTKVLAPTFL